MAKLWVALVVVAQVLALSYMAGQREYIRATGDIVYFPTAPLDPRDPLRGDYVRLRYDISELRYKHFANSEIDLDADRPLQKDEVLYVSLTTDNNDVARFASVSRERPQSGIFIKGRTNYPWYASSQVQINMRYGIEQFFLEQGQGLAMEERMGRRGEIQIPLEVEVALGADGTAVTRGYRWSDLGIKTEIVMPPRNNNGDNTITSPQITITIQNVSEKPLALVDNQLHCSFSLESEGWTDDLHNLTLPPCDNYRPEPDDIIHLAPEEMHQFAFDLSQPQWHVNINGERQEIGNIRTGERFRLIYQSPDQEFIQSLDSNNEIWIGELPSQAFFPSGRID